MTGPADWRAADLQQLLGVPGTSLPDLDTLVELHRSHVERVPYSTLELVLARQVPADLESSVTGCWSGAEATASTSTVPLPGCWTSSGMR